MAKETKIKTTELKVISLEDVEKQVSGATKFEQTIEYLKEEVLKSKDFVIKDFNDPVQIEQCKRFRIDLRKVEIDIEKRGKSYRDIFTKVNKQILDKEKELTKITSPEIERLEKEEEAATIALQRQERQERLPARKERLDVLNDGVEVSDDILLDMDGTQFEAYINQRTQAKLENDRLVAEQKQKQAENELAEQKRLIEQEAEAKRQEEQAKIDKANAEILAERKKLDDKRVEFERQKQAALKDKPTPPVVEKPEEPQINVSENSIVNEAGPSDRRKMLDFAMMIESIVLPDVYSEKEIKVARIVTGLLIKVSNYIKDNLK